MLNEEISCYIISEDKLSLQCAETLLSKSHRILGIISSVLSIQSWAIQHRIPHFTSLSELKNSDLKESCDYFFSIVNYQILPEWILTLPKYFAINYHDSLLPRYAGVHATSWALINDEKTHGITWHVMDEQLDSGDIIKQAITTIDHDETALSLNLKCYNLAITTFSDLIDELSDGTYLRTPQNLDQRSYYSRYQKPLSNGWINWRQPACDIDKICRALQFGYSINRFATPKFALGNDVFIVDQHYVTQHLSQAEPGSIVNIGSQALEIATQTYDIALSKFRTLNNNPYTPLELGNKYLLRIGDKLKKISDEEHLYIERTGMEISVHEDFWVHELERNKPIHIPFLKPHLPRELSSKYNLFSQIKVDKSIVQQTIQHDPTTNKGEFFLTLLFVYLYRLSNQESFTSGYNINKTVTDDLLFTNQVPLNIDFDQQMNFESCLKQVQKQLNTIINKGSYLKDIVCRYPTLTCQPMLLPFSIVMIDDITGYSFKQFNELIVVIEVSKGLFHLFVNESLQMDFNLITVLRNIPGHMKRLMSELTTAQGKNYPISRLNILTKKECLKILNKWTKTDALFCQDKAVHQLFEDQVTKTPDKTAITFQAASLTYLELNQKSNQLAHYLRKKGIKREMIVAICLNRGLDMVISLLGVIKAGAAYVPVDPKYPNERIKFIVTNSQAKRVISHSSNKVSELFDSNINLIIDQEWPIINNETNNNLVNETQPGDLIYLIYTSGSTGKPKGVLVENKGVVNCLLSIAKKIKISSNDKFLAVTPLSFDVAALDYYLPLSFGASITIASETDRKDGAALIELLYQKKISAMQATPSTWQMLVIGCWKGAKNFKILTAGEALSKNLSAHLQQRGHLFNIYGPTETTIYATLCQIKKNSLVSIGKPIANTKAFVLNSDKMPQPIGVLGELYISGIGVARGYLRDDEATKNNFIEDTIGDYKTRVYKTGDLVRWLPDGNLEYIGRIDNQVKLRGYRIELGEIEHRLLDYLGISHAIVLPYEKKGYKQLVAYIKKDGSLPELTEEKLRNHLSNQLPDYMIPSVFIELAEIPLSTSGKIKRNALLQMYPPTSFRKKSYITSPSTSVETILCHIWEDYFGIKPISTKDNFFHLGGDSILAMQIASKARQQNIHLSVEQIFLHPTIVELASIVEEINLSIKGHQEDINVKFPLAPVQSWFFSQHFLRQQQWGQACLIDVMQSIDENILHHCLQELLDEHDALKINFQLEDGVWKQHYTSNSSLPFHVADIPTSFSQNEWDQYLEQWELKILETFNLEHGPLIGAVLFKKDQAPQKLLIVAHHLIVDGISWRILCHDLFILYKKLIGQSKSTIHKTTSYKHWISEAYRHIQLSITEKDKSFWLEQKAANPLPKDFAETQNTEEDAANYMGQLSIKETEFLLKQPIKNASIKINGILLAMLARTLENWTGNNSLLIDMEGHGRDELVNKVDVSNTMGWFTSIFPLYLNWPVGAPLDILLETIQTQLSVIPGNGITYGALRYFDLDVNVRAALKNKPKSEIVFNYWGQFSSHLENDIFHLNTVHLRSAKENKRPYVLDISCWISQKQFYISFNYNRKHYQFETIKLVTNNYIDTIRKFLQDSNIEQLSTPSIKNLIQETNNNIEAVYPLASLQKGLLFHSIQSPTSGSYIVQCVWESPKNFNLCINTLRSAWRLLVNRHQALRTCFIWGDSHEPSQIVQRTAEFSWNVYDWQDIKVHQEAKRLKQFLQADLQAGFDLTKPALLRVTILRLPRHQYHLIITVPHILLDGWSLAILFKELSTCYQAIINNNIPSLPPAIPYNRFIAWQCSQNLLLAQKFWKEYLKGFLAPTDLVITNSGYMLSDTSTEISISELTLTPEITTQIKQFCQQKKVTINTFFQSIWGLVLYSYSQNNDVVFGVTLTERNPDIKDSEQMVGLLINTLPLRIYFENDISVRDYLNQVQQNFLKIANYHYTPLANIQEWSEISNGASLFHTLLVFENYPILEDDTQFFKFKDINIIDPTHYPLACIVFPGQNIKIKLAFDKRRISTDAILRLQGHLQTILTTLMDHPQQSISSISLLTPNEKQQILIGWNNTTTFYPRHKTIHQLFEEQVAKTPNKIALMFEEQQIAYSELDNLANQMANYLLSKNIKNSDLVVICMEHCLEIAIAILGTLKIGGVYIPIDPNYPAKRIQDILRDAEPAVVITKQNIHQKNKFNLPNNQIVYFESLAAIYHFSVKAPKAEVKADDLAYIIYTSGSTGKPKGVLVEHRALVNFLSAMRLYINPTSEDNILALTSIAFDISGLEFYLPIIVGAKCVIASHGTAGDGNKLKQVIIKNQISILQATPVTWKFLLESGWKNKSVKQILCGGEALPNSLAEQLLKKADKVWNLYGPTETTIWSTIHLISPGQRYRAIPIGKPIKNTQLFVLNNNYQPVPIGIIGELYIGGDGLARGYLNNPIMTKRKFIPNPFSKNPNDRLYKTGDLVRWLPDGNLEYIQRIDDQVKLNGFRIELSEIQAHLQEHPIIKQAVAIIQGEGLGKKYITAYVIPNSKVLVSDRILHSFLQKRLPSYMLPTFYIILDAFPVTTNGKIDIQALSLIRPNRPVKEDDVLSLTKVERLLVTVWKEILGKQQIGKDDDFFKLGGHSLSALQMLTKINQHFQIDLSVRALFENPTIEQLGKVVKLLQLERTTLLAVTRKYKCQIEDSCLITLQPNGNRTPLFLVHPIGGTVFWYVPLVKYLKQQRPVYGIQDLGIETGKIPFASIQEMASFYIKVIQKVQPHGPYYLGGASAGANISVEIAYQLSQIDEPVKFIGLLDGWAYYPQSLQDRELFEAIMRRQHNTMLNMFSAKGIDGEFLLKLQWARSRIYNEYIPPYLHNQLTLFKAKKILSIFESIESRFNHWEQYSTIPIKVYNVPGNHESMFQEPNVAALGTLVNKCLNQADIN